MASPKYDSFNIDEELRNSRRIVEKSMELSKRYAINETTSDYRVTDLLEKLRNEEYLKNSFEKVLKETLILLKEAQRKNFEYERKIGHLEGIVEEGNSQKMMIIENRLEKLERNIVGQAQEYHSLNLANSKRRSNSTFDHSEGNEHTFSQSQRIKDLEYKILLLENTVKKEKLNKYKTEKALITNSAIKSKTTKVPLKYTRRINK